ncbi:uncharacterized protein LOC116351526 [Contarinia nasturtii]|uniref:uncharacterized protein LOC116351526 n=1 Tax=Contarinia nasturtii TaxID=265458 RepID=UPI0012D4014E|nr:uncharacterized protein LOC116351526 [Contarinia nasturtii]
MNSQYKKTRKSTVGQKVIHLFGPPEDKKDEKGTTKTLYQCHICSKKINGTKDCNLVSHIRSVHPENYVEIVEKFKDPLEVKRLKILQNAVELVTVNGRPFSAIQDSGYIANIENKLNKLKANGLDLDLSHNKLYEVKNHLKLTADNARNKVREEVQDKLVSSTIDITTLNSRSFLDISVRFIANGKLIIRSISMIELHESHTGIYLANIFANEMESYGISLRSVVAISRDHGSNVIKMVRDLNCLADRKQVENRTIDSIDMETVANSNEELDVDGKISELLAENITDDEALDMLFQENETNMALNSYNNILNDVSQHLLTHGVESNVNIAGIDCVAHKVQLITKDGLKMMWECDRNVIDLARCVSKELRLQSVRDEMFHLNLQYTLPRLEVKTRWCSTFLMVSDVLSFLQESAYILGIMYKTTVELQARGLTLSDVYALFLDPRYRNQVMNDENKFEEAVETLCDTFNRINHINSHNQNDNIVNTSNTSTASEEFDINVAMRSFMIENSESNSSDHTTSRAIESLDIEHKIRAFQPDTLDHSKSVVEYWEKFKTKHPELYQLASVIFAVSPTEVENERNFSSLKHVFSDRRCNLAEERLKDIMFLHMNSDLFYAVKEDQISDLVAKLDIKAMARDNKLHS